MMQHTMSCTWPEGCNCGASEFNRLEDQLSKERAEHAQTKERVKVLEEAIVTFCAKQDWAVDSWKQQPGIAKLFKIRDDLKKSEGSP